MEDSRQSVAALQSQLDDYRERSRKDLQEAQRNNKDRLVELQRAQNSLKAQQDEVRTEEFTWIVACWLTAPTCFPIQIDMSLGSICKSSVQQPAEPLVFGYYSNTVTKIAFFSVCFPG